MKPSIGRIVHFVMPSGEHRPAIITRVWADEVVNMTIFLDGPNLNRRALALPESLTQWGTSVQHDEDERKPNTWHWPERE